MATLTKRPRGRPKKYKPETHDSNAMIDEDANDIPCAQPHPSPATKNGICAIPRCCNPRKAGGGFMCPTHYKSDSIKNSMIKEAIVAFEEFNTPKCEIPTESILKLLTATCHNLVTILSAIENDNTFRVMLGTFWNILIKECSSRLPDNWDKVICKCPGYSACGLANLVKKGELAIPIVVGASSTVSSPEKANFDQLCSENEIFSSLNHRSKKSSSNPSKPEMNTETLKFSPPSSSSGEPKPSELVSHSINQYSSVLKSKNKKPPRKKPSQKALQTPPQPPFSVTEQPSTSHENTSVLSKRKRRDGTTTFKLPSIPVKRIKIERETEPSVTFEKPKSIATTTTTTTTGSKQKKPRTVVEKLPTPKKKTSNFYASDSESGTLSGKKEPNNETSDDSQDLELAPPPRATLGKSHTKTPVIPTSPERNVSNLNYLTGTPIASIKNPDANPSEEIPIIKGLKSFSRNFASLNTSTPREMLCVSSGEEEEPDESSDPSLVDDSDSSSRNNSDQEIVIDDSEPGQPLDEDAIYLMDDEPGPTEIPTTTSDTSSKYDYFDNSEDFQPLGDVDLLTLYEPTCVLNEGGGIATFSGPIPSINR